MILWKGCYMERRKKKRKSDELIDRADAGQLSYELSDELQQQEDAALKVAMQAFAEELLPYLGIQGKVIGIAPTEIVHLELKKLFQDFNLIMEDGTWKHFEFQSKNEGLDGLKRFRAYESLMSYQYKVSITTYVLFSGNISNPMTEFTEGNNTYRITPIIMRHRNADEVINGLRQKLESAEPVAKKDLIPLMLCNLMSGESSQKERVKAAFEITQKMDSVGEEEIRKIEAVLYAMADKFLEKEEMEEILEDISMTKLGQMLVNKGFSQGISEGISQGITQGTEKNKLENARNLLDVLDVSVIAEKIGLPLETVQKLKDER